MSKFFERNKKIYVKVAALASDLENEDAPSTNIQRSPPSNLPEVPLTEPDSSDVAFSSSSIPAPTPAQRMKTSNMLKQEESHLPIPKKSDDLMAQLMFSPRKIPRPTSPIIRIPTSNADTGSSSQPVSQLESQLSRLSNHDQDESTADNDNSQALLRGIMIDLKSKECPFLDLSRVRDILERTHIQRYTT